MHTGPLPNADNYFFIADSYLRNIYQVDATSGVTGQLLPFGLASKPMSVVHCPSTKSLYWTDIVAHTINRYSLLTNTSSIIYRDPNNTGTHRKTLNRGHTWAIFPDNNTSPL